MCALQHAVARIFAFNGRAAKINFAPKDPVKNIQHCNRIYQRSANGTKKTSRAQWERIKSKLIYFCATHSNIAAYMYIPVHFLNNKINLLI